MVAMKKKNYIFFNISFQESAILRSEFFHSYFFISFYSILRWREKQQGQL